MILEVTFADQERYMKDRREHRTTKIYMLEPEVFVLPDLVSANPKRKPLRSLKARRVVRGHLERKDPLPVPVLQDVEVSVQRVTHFRQFDPKAKKPARLEYLLFGKGQELFLAHLITAPPDFVQMLAVKVTGHAFTDEELAQGVSVGFPGSTNTAALEAQRAAARRGGIQSRKGAGTEEDSGRSHSGALPRGRRASGATYLRYHPGGTGGRLPLR